jgi:hypothetical protein
MNVATLIPGNAPESSIAQLRRRATGQAQKHPHGGARKLHLDFAINLKSGSGIKRQASETRPAGIE